MSNDIKSLFLCLVAVICSCLSHYVPLVKSDILGLVLGLILWAIGLVFLMLSMRFIGNSIED